MQEGFSLRIIEGYLVIDDIPFVDAAAHGQRGSLLCPLDTDGTTTTAPTTHVMCFVGGVPHDRLGNPIPGLVNDGVEKWSAGADLMSSCGFSQKPQGGYRDFYEKVTYYAAIIVGPAQALDTEASPHTSRPVKTDEDDGVFLYLDTFSSRAGITELNNLLALPKVAIIGLGGTGAHILDALAKTPVETIHLYDNDIFRSHNAFRAPGAAGLDDLQAACTKVDYYAHVYSRMRRGVVPHPVNVTADNVAEIADADFVFLAMDTGPDKKTIVETLLALHVPFIDTGVGLSQDTSGIAGQLRITTATTDRSDHIRRDGLISYFAGEDAEYNTNLQVDELNALTANLAILRYKKALGFYADVEQERHSVFVVNSADLHSRYGSSDEHERVEADADADADAIEAHLKQIDGAATHDARGVA